MKKMQRLVAALSAIPLVAAMAMNAIAEPVNTVTVTKFHQSYPYSGKATVEYTVGGTLPANAVAEITISTDGKDNATLQSAGYIDATGNFNRTIGARSGGQSVRPVQDAD